MAEGDIVFSKGSLEKKTDDKGGVESLELDRGCLSCHRWALTQELGEQIFGITQICTESVASTFLSSELEE